MKGIQFNHGKEKAWPAQTTPHRRVCPHGGATSYNEVLPHGRVCPHGEATSHNKVCVAHKRSSSTQSSQSCQDHPSPLAKNTLYLRAARAITKAKERYIWALVIQEEKKQRCSRELEALKEVTSRAVSLISFVARAITKAKERYIWLLSSQNDLGGAL